MTNREEEGAAVAERRWPVVETSVKKRPRKRRCCPSARNESRGWKKRKGSSRWLPRNRVAIQMLTQRLRGV